MIPRLLNRASIRHSVKHKGYVRWVLTDEKTGKITGGGRSNILVNFMREKLASAMIGGTVTFPQFVAVGTGTSTPAGSDTALQTLSKYDGVNDAKQADSRSIRSLYTSRIITQFATTEANITVRELGLYDAANAGNLWARVSVNITKTNTQRLTIYWYITFERSTDVAIKTGASIGATGTITAATPSTLTFASTVTILIIHNNSGEVLYFKINEALDAADPPVDYDFMLDNNETFMLVNEEIEVSTISVYGATISGAMPLNKLSCVGW